MTSKNTTRCATNELYHIFYCRLHPHLVGRFEMAFKKSGNSLITINDVHFVQLNSMEMARDGCFFCKTAELEIEDISMKLKCAKNKDKIKCDKIVDAPKVYSRPILLQHFPTYRKSDESCIEHDSPVIEIYKESREVLSKNATEYLRQKLHPRVAFSGHSHHYCYTKSRLGVEEYTIASFSWRNKNNPSFFLVRITKNG